MAGYGRNPRPGNCAWRYSEQERSTVPRKNALIGDAGYQRPSKRCWKHGRAHACVRACAHAPGRPSPCLRQAWKYTFELCCA
eukprot:2633292-Pleurochrysis_carterae.AAC.1